MKEAISEGKVDKKAFLEFTDQGFAVLSNDKDTILYTNAAFKKFSGAKNVSLQSLSGILDQEKIQGIQKLLDKVAPGNPITFTVNLLTQPDTSYLFDIHKKEDEDHFFCILRPISDLEKRLESDEYYQTISENIPNGAVFLIDKNFRILMAQGEEIKEQNANGYYKGKSIYELYDGPRLEFLTGVFERVFKGEKFQFEDPHDGVVHQFTASPVFNSHGEVETAIFLSQNITAQKETEKKLTENIHELNFYKKAIDTVALVAITDIEGNVSYINDEFSKRTGYSSEDFKAGGLSIIKSGHHNKGFFRKIETKVANGEVWKGEILYKCEGGEEFWVKCFIIPFLDNTQNINKYFHINFDINQRKKFEMELESRNFELNSFAYHTSHDLRAPLASILGLTNLAEQEEDLARIKEYISFIQTSVKKQDTFIRTILDHTISNSQLIYQEKINFQCLVHNTLEDLKYLKNSEKLKVSTFIKGSEEFSGDRMRIGIIFKNLISNAICYLNPHANPSFLQIDINVSESEATVIFEDNGVGIQDEVIKNIFNMFYRGNESSQGSGLGLYILKQTVEKMGGKIRLESKLSKGTKIVLNIPAIQTGC